VHIHLARSPGQDIPARRRPRLGVPKLGLQGCDLLLTGLLFAFQLAQKLFGQVDALFQVFDRRRARRIGRSFADMVCSGV